MRAAPEPVVQKKWLPPAGQYFSTRPHIRAWLSISVPWLGQVPARQKLCLGCPTRLYSAWPGQKRRAQEEAKPIIMQRETKGKSRRSRCDFPKPVTTYHAAPTETSKNAQSWRLRPFFFPLPRRAADLAPPEQNKEVGVFFSAPPMRLSFIILTRAIFPGLVSRLGPASGCRHVETKCPTLKLTPMVAVRLLQQLGPIYSTYVQSQCEGCGTGSVSDV